MLTVVKDVPASAPETRELSGSFLNCVVTISMAPTVDAQKSTHVGHPVKAFIAAVKEIIGL